MSDGRPPPSPGSQESIVGSITVLLHQLKEGDTSAHEPLFEALYDDLARIAGRRLARESADVDLEPHSLVHEAYLRLVDLDRVAWNDRGHFLAIAARVMRQVLVDSARERRAQKRDGGVRVTISGIAARGQTLRTDVLQLHESLERLAQIDPERARLVELRYFGGLTIEEAAEEMGSSPASVKRSWVVARAWLYEAMRLPPDRPAAPAA